MQVFLYIFSAFIIRDIKNKADELNQNNQLNQGRVLLLTNIPLISAIELKAHLNDRWKGLCNEQPLYINFVYDISDMKSKMDRLVKLASYRIQILKWRDLMINFGLTTEAFATRTFDPKAPKFTLNSFQKLAHPYPDFEDRKLNLNQVNFKLRKLHASINDAHKT